MIGLLLYGVGPIANAEATIAAFAAAVAIVGSFVAFLAYHGYRRNGSRPMLYLAVGIAFLTAVPVVIDYGVGALLPATDAEILFAITIAHLAGVLAILYALTKA
ncbi:DUF7521 family protein [Natrinema soli]|uniref:Histidine kinase n=1 Tax=Natrinema soli TaxID=1930624 RepID=A0ABD5SK82_9EURY|nr:hypothetical protein [Natrinema soli]